MARRRHPGCAYGTLDRVAFSRGDRAGFARQTCGIRVHFTRWHVFVVDGP